MVIIDASVVFKWITDEESLPNSDKLLIQFLKKREEYIAPDILLYEIGNAFIWSKTLSDDTRDVVWQRFKELEIPLFSPDKLFIEKVIIFAKSRRISAYDGSYVVLAAERHGTLITADKKLVFAINEPYVRFLGDKNLPI